ncbi:sensor histidine kinase [Peredibacter starrii]|uniref:histidine kinase n=1 Tax=Peredibacter starrii TaxID=28202 RepID=A0AAX4HNL3_9BACT|nr:sensor histidine kinase [Peredibacter starrii]WPU64524.1 sensor histidine kinase [Peredibacter starrii]
MSKITSEMLRNKISEIIYAWEERVLQEVHAAKLQKGLALRNSLREFINQLAEELSDSKTRSSKEVEEGKQLRTRIGKQHGQARANSILYTLDQLIYEYHVLRQVIFKVLERDQPIELNDREIITEYIEQAVNDAATEFSYTLKAVQDQLSRTLAHDLRNPISIAKASAELILRRPDDENSCIDKATRIVSSMSRIDKMIRDLLDATKIKAGELPSMDLKICDVDWILREVVLELNLAEAEKVILKSKAPINGYWNEDALRRITENLITNAIKYGKTKTPVIVSVQEKDHFVSINVHNDGPPISEQDMKKLFQPFERAKSSEGKTGWGIGLTVVKTLVDALHGEITVTSVEDEGTTFSITLPIDFRNEREKPIFQ